ncbi:MAG: hypothetical protein M1838_003872 [Thelocarpon superellum]|nr:MAG: hypothetical protein M1838_003872 [Thelocarpon superellum]
MSTFELANTTPKVSVELTPDLSQEQLLAFPAFTRWLSTLQHSLSLQASQPGHPFHPSPYHLRKITVQSVDRFGGKRLGFVKLQAEVTNADGEKLPGSVFLRGGSVGMMVILQPDDVSQHSEKDKYVLLTMQPRVPAGSLSMIELPAGMIDDSGTFAGAAAKEIQEEIGLEIPEDELTDMTKLGIDSLQDTTGEDLPRGVYPSPGGCDEFVPIFLHQRQVPRAQLDQWQGKLTGLRGHGEKITLQLVPLEHVWRHGARDAKALAAWALYQELRREGRLPNPVASCQY